MEGCQESRRIEAHSEKWKLLSGHVFLFGFQTGSLIVEDDLDLLVFMPELFPQTQIQWSLSIGRVSI